MPVHNIETAEDFQKILKENPTVVVDWFATWCGPCKAIAPLVVQQSNDEKFKDVFFAKVDVDVVGELAAECGIRAMPTFQLYKNGEKVDELLGANPTKLTELISQGL